MRPSRQYWHRLKPVLSKYIKEVNTISGQSSGIGEDRNRIVHDAWYYDKASGAVAQFKSMPNSDRRYGIREFDVARVQQTLKDIEKYSKKADNLFNRMNADIAALIEKSTPMRVSFPSH